MWQAAGCQVLATQLDTPILCLASTGATVSQELNLQTGMSAPALKAHLCLPGQRLQRQNMHLQQQGEQDLIHMEVLS